MTRAAVAGRVAARTSRSPIHGSFIAAARTALGHPGAVVGASVAWVASAAPVAAAFVAGRPELVVLAVLPVLLVATGVHRALAALVADGPVAWRELPSVDPVLAAATWAGVLAVVVLLGAGDAGVLAASLIGAAWVLVVPLALAYSAVRDRRGLAALRGGAILALVRPDLALTAAGLMVLAAFAVVATAGALAVCLPAFVALFTTRAVASELAILDPGAFSREGEIDAS